MIRLKKAAPQDRERLWNINQKYLYEMTRYYPDEMDEKGNYHYGYFDAYFTEAERAAYFIYEEDICVGFAMIHPYSYIGHTPDHVMAEFSIFPSYRKRHLAVRASQLILHLFPGRWEIKFHEENSGAKKLWEFIAAPYDPMVYHLNEKETVLEFSTENNGRYGRGDGR